MSGAPIIVCVGSLHHDVIVRAERHPARGETLMGEAFRTAIGGKGGNQAVAARREGAAVRMVGAVGRDAEGDALLGHLCEADVDAAYVKRLEGMRSGMSVAIEDARGDYGAVVVSGANLHVDARELDKDAPWEGASMLMLQNETAPEANLAAARAARARNVPVCLNAAPHRPLDPAFEALVDVLIVNEVEAAQMTGWVVDDVAEARAVAVALADRFARVVVTLGARGAVHAEGGEVAHAPAASVEVVSAHGAGDAFTGALCVALARGASLAEAVRLAVDRAGAHVAGER